ncbi:MULTISPECIES: hypothetical protein [unclassified Flavobacterium]|uniref:hypothetical protein n=1 Tax=unclassified Flavobacterium TaxID=196869 RepID=UPI001291644E|nr:MULTISPECIES: hypothetical protein [unclassified Flavobacterium]MQP52147.1 hypothetical protein [Flavobacterium sp. LMO9]MQP62016.1 hypothetical protein [Flavobacterium sp. LMO6]
MLRILTLFFISFLFYSCDKKKEDEVVLELQNTNLNYTFNLDSIYSRRFFSEQQQDSSCNVVVFRIKNFTDKKLLFLSRDIDLNQIYGLKLNFYEGDSLIKTGNILTDPVLNDSIRDYYFHALEHKFNLEKLKNKKLKKIGAKSNFDLMNSYVSQSVVLFPNEEREFVSLLSLPFIRELDTKIIEWPTVINFNKNKQYFFSIEYQIDEKLLIKELTKNQIEDLKRNNIEIFSGKLESNKIPVINYNKY